MKPPSQPPRSLVVLRVDRKPKLSQTSVATKAMLSLSRYWQIEAGVGKPPTDDEKADIAKVLGVPVGAIAWPDVVPVKVRRAS